MLAPTEEAPVHHVDEQARTAPIVAGGPRGAAVDRRRGTRRRGLSAGVVALAVALGAAGCARTDAAPAAPAPTSSSTAPTTAPTTEATPGTAGGGAEAAAGAATTVTATVPAGVEAGEVLAAEPIEGAPAGARAWRVRYRSSTIDGAPNEVTGVIVAPDGPGPAGGRPIVSWAHGTSGVADVCAPSRAGTSLVPDLEGLVAAGYVVAATDYEGMGTPGTHPYLVAGSEGRGVLDAARAARRLEGTGAGDRLLLWGHSQGGHAALAAAELAPSYAPELDLAGTVATAPASDLRELGRLSEAGVDLGGWMAMLLAGFAQAYPDQVDLARTLTPEAVERLPVVEQTCTMGILEAFAGVRVAQPGALGRDPWPALLEANSVGLRPVAGPVLVVQGTEDRTVLPATVEVLVERLCDLGVPTERAWYEGADHISVMPESYPRVQTWMAARLAGAPLEAPCAPPAPAG